MAQHGFFHQRIAGADRDAVAARNAARFSNGGSAIPEHSRIRIFPVDGERFIDLDVLTCLYAAATQNALVGIVAVERVRVIDLVRFRSERYFLVLDGQQFRGVMDDAIAVVVVADGAVQHVVAQNAIECFHLGRLCLR